MFEMLRLSNLKTTLKTLLLLQIIRTGLRMLLRKRRIERLIQIQGNNQVALITGGASGIGKQSVKLFVSKGWKVYAIDVNKTGLEDLATECQNESQLVTVRVDVTNKQECVDLHSLIAKDPLVEKQGLSCLVNCAGIAIPAPLLSLTDSQRDLQLDVNLLSPMRLVGMFKEMLATKGTGGSVVNVASTSGYTAWPWQGYYSTTKFALIGFTDTLRREALHSGVKLRAVSICPGAVETPLATTMTRRATKWVEENPGDLFISGAKASADFRNKLPEDYSVRAFFATPLDVAQAIYAAAVDPTPPAHDQVAGPGFALLQWLLVSLPFPLSDRLVNCV